MSNDPKLEANIKAALDVVTRARKLVRWLDRIALAKLIRAFLEKLEGYPTLENDLEVIENRLRGMLTSDPDKTPRVGITSKGFPAVKRPKE